MPETAQAAAARRPMRFGDLVWPVMGIAWIPALLPAVASLALGDAGIQSPGLAQFGTLVGTPALFVPLYCGLLLAAMRTGWPRAPAGAPCRPRLAFLFTAIGLTFGLLLFALVATAWGGDVAMGDFCDPLIAARDGGSDLDGLTLRIDGAPTLICLLDPVELGMTVLSVGLPLSLLTAAAMLLAYGIAISAGLALKHHRRASDRGRDNAERR